MYHVLVIVTTIKILSLGKGVNVDDCNAAICNDMRLI